MRAVRAWSLIVCHRILFYSAVCHWRRFVQLKAAWSLITDDGVYCVIFCAVCPHSKRRIPSRQLPLCLSSAVQQWIETDVEQFRVDGGPERVERGRTGEGIRREPSVRRHWSAGELSGLRSSLFRRTLHARARLYGRVWSAATRHSARRPESQHHCHYHPYLRNCATTKDQGCSAFCVYHSLS